MYVDIKNYFTTIRQYNQYYSANYIKFSSTSKEQIFTIYPFSTYTKQFESSDLVTSPTIQYSILNQSNVTLKVFDVLGSEVTTLVNKEQPQGNYEIEFDGIDPSSGIYFYRLQAGEFVETKKMILLK